MYFAIVLLRKTLQLLSLLIAFSLQAQTVEWSNQQKQRSKTGFSQVAGENNYGYFLIRSKDNEFSKDLFAERYKSNLAIDVSTELWQPENSYIQRVLLENTGLLLVALSKNSVSEKYDLTWWRTDQNFNTDQKAHLLFSIEGTRYRNHNPVNVKFSPDKKIIYMIYISEQTDNDKSVLNVHAYQADFTPIYVRKYPLEVDADDVYVSSFECDNDGNVFLLADMPKSGKKKKEFRNYFFYGISSKQPDLTEFLLNNDTTDFNDIGMVINNYDHSIAVTGFFKTQKEENAVDGMYMGVFDIPVGTFRMQKFFAFDKSIISKFAAVVSNTNSPGLSDLYVRKLIPRSDGGCVVIAEKFYETKQTYTYYVNGFPQQSSKTVYNFDDVLVFSLNAKAEIQFTEVVKKRQSSINDAGYYSSFVAANTNNSLAIIYSLDATAESDVMITSITPKGEADTKILIRSMSYYVSLMPPESKQVNANTVLICALKDRKFSLMKIAF